MNLSFTINHFLLILLFPNAISILYRFFAEIFEFKIDSPVHAAPESLLPDAALNISPKVLEKKNHLRENLMGSEEVCIV